MTHIPLATFKAYIEELNGHEGKRYYFEALGEGGQHTDQQKEYAFELIRESGIRATARFLHIPRRTLQRWCRKHKIYVRRCPDWVYEWVGGRRRRREFWARRGYG